MCNCNDTGKSILQRNSQSFSYAQNMSHPSNFTKFQLCAKYVSPIKIHKVSAMRKICLTHQNPQSFSYAQNMSHTSKFTKFQLCTKYVSPTKIHKVSAMRKICLTHQNSPPNDTPCKAYLFPYTAFTVLPL